LTPRTPVGVLSVEPRDGGGRLLAEVEVRALREALNVPALPAVAQAPGEEFQER
jgi:hypothetical protein